MTPEVGATYSRQVQLPGTLVVTDCHDDGADALVWGKGPDGATYRLPLAVFAAVYGGPELHPLDRAELTRPAPT